MTREILLVIFTIVIARWSGPKSFIFVINYILLFLILDVDADSDPSYENIDEEDILSYENIEPPLLYQCKQTADSSSLGAASDEPLDAYENLKFQKTAAHPDVSVISLNKTITPDPIASTVS